MSTANGNEHGLHPIRWGWQSKDSDTRVAYASMDGRTSVTELLAYLREVAPDVSLDEVWVNFSTVKWTRPATEEELAERRAYQAEHREALERWERETLARLTAKYGTPEQR